MSFSWPQSSTKIRHWMNSLAVLTSSQPGFDMSDRWSRRLVSHSKKMPGLGGMEKCLGPHKSPKRWSL